MTVLSLEPRPGPMSSTELSQTTQHLNQACSCTPWALRVSETVSSWVIKVLLVPSSCGVNYNCLCPTRLHNKEPCLFLCMQGKSWQDHSYTMWFDSVWSNYFVSRFWKGETTTISIPPRISTGGQEMLSGGLILQLGGCHIPSQYWDDSRLSLCGSFECNPQLFRLLVAPLEH